MGTAGVWTAHSSHMSISHTVLKRLGWIRRAYMKEFDSYFNIYDDTFHAPISPEGVFFLFRRSSVYALWIALVHRYSGDHHTHLTSIRPHMFTPLRPWHLKHMCSFMHEKCAVDGWQERCIQKKSEGETGGLEMLLFKCACPRERREGKMENEEGEGLSSFDCLWPSCPVYRQHPSPWRQSLSSAAAEGEKSAKKKKG